MGGTYIKAGKHVPDKAWLLNAGAAIAKVLEVRVLDQAERHAGVTRDISVTDCVTNALLGALWRLWAYADSEIRSDNTLPLTREGVAQVMRLPVWMLDYFPSEWLRITGESCVELPNYCEENRIKGKDERKKINEIKRAQSRDRSSRYRSRRSSRTRHARVTHDVTQPSRTTSREKSVTTGTGTVTGRPLPVGEQAGTREAVPGSLASAQGTSRAGVDSAVKNGHAATPDDPLQERQRRARALHRQLPAVERSRLMAMFRLTASELDDALAEIPLSTAASAATGDANADPT